MQLHVDTTLKSTKKQITPIGLGEDKVKTSTIQQMSKLAKQYEEYDTAPTHDP